jgi:ribokinase
MDARGDGIVLVAGQVARDLVLAVDEMPGPGASASVTERRELLGGKGANQAVGLRQLGVEVALLGVLGIDPAGDDLSARVRSEGITPAIARRGTTALLTDVVAPGGERRLLEHVPDESLLRMGDLDGCEPLLDRVDTVCLQLQQPTAVLLELARRASARQAWIVLDGAADAPGIEELIGLATVVRADASEAQQLTGVDIDSPDDARSAAGSLLERGVEVIAFGVPGQGDLVAWQGGDRFHPFDDDEKVVDPTGAGDAFTVALTAALRSGRSPDAAGGFAAAAARDTVGRLGGRPELAALRKRLE